MDIPIQLRIKERREAFGASVASMAQLAGLAPERWEEIEAGGGFNVADLGQLSRALAVDVGALLRGKERDPQRTVARFRKESSLKDFSLLETRTLCLAAELGRIGGALLRMLERRAKLLEARQPEPVNNLEPEWQQGYKLGALARKRLAIEPGPILNLQLALEELDVHVASLGFSEPTVDAANLLEPEAMPVILLNQASPRIAQRLPRRTALAHELCHLLHDVGEHDLETHLSGREEPVPDPIEQRARAFAPAFLAPPDEVREYFTLGEGSSLPASSPGQRVLALARHWGLSWSGAVWHAKNCQLFENENTAELLIAEGGPRQDWQSDFEREITQVDLPEAFEPSQLSLGRLANLVFEAFEDGAISEGRAKEILSWC